jgi:hypothetical protein
MLFVVMVQAPRNATLLFALAKEELPYPAQIVN